MLDDAELWVWCKLGRICSNSFEFWFFEFHSSNLNVDFGQIWLLWPNSIKFDLKFARIWTDSTNLDQLLSKNKSFLCLYSCFEQKITFSWQKRLFFKPKSQFFDLIWLFHGQIQPYWNKIEHRLWSNSNFKAKFDLKFKFWIRLSWSNSESFLVNFEIRPSLVWCQDTWLVVF